MLMPEKNANINEKYILYQVLAQNLEGLKQQLELVEQQMMELKSTSVSLDDIKQAGTESEIFLPLGSGCFSRGRITDNKRMLVNVGAGVFIDKEMKDVRAFVETNLKELEKAGIEIEEQMRRMAAQMNELASDIQEIAAREGRKS